MNVAEFAGLDHGEILFVWSPKIKTQIFKFIVFPPLRSALLYIGLHNGQMPARYCEENSNMKNKYSKRKCEHTYTLGIYTLTYKD